MSQGSITNNAINSVVTAQKLVAISQDNISRAKMPSAHRVDPEVTAHEGSIKVALKRATSPDISLLLSQSITEAAAAHVIKDSLNALQTIITSHTTKMSKLTEKIVEFIKTATQVVSSPSMSFKQAFVRQGEMLAQVFSNTSDEILALRLKADQDLMHALNSASQIVFELFNLNNALTTNPNPDLLDRRDLLINNLAEFVEIKVSEDANGRTLISTTDGSLNLVNNTSYARFNYRGIAGARCLKELSDIKPIMIDYIDKSCKVIGALPVVAGPNAVVSKISDGKIASYLKLRDDILVKAGAQVKALASEVFDNVNIIHNKYSPFPPKSSLISHKDFTSLEPLNWQGKLTITTVDKSNSGPGGSNLQTVRPCTIDLDALATNMQGRSLTVADMLNEINAYLDTSSATRLAIGQFQETLPSGASRCAYLVNNMKMIALNIDAAGQFTFDLELDGNQYFGSTVQVLRAESLAGRATNMPQTFKLAKGERTRTNQPIVVSGITGGVQDIDLHIRVIGDNGVVAEGTASFKVNPTTLADVAPILNKRISGVVASFVGATSMVELANDTAPIAVAKLIDEQKEVAADLTTSTTQGKLVITTYNKDHGLVIESDLDETTNGFSNFCGINNFFVRDLDGTFEVNKTIVADPSRLLAVGGITRAAQLQTVKAGATAAEAAIEFSGQPGPGSKITLSSVTFTYVDVLTSNANEVKIGHDLATSLQNLAQSINSNLELSLIVSAHSTAGNALNISAKNLGTSGNSITLSAEIIGNTSTITPLNAPPTGPSNNVTTTLGGGTNSQVQVEEYTRKLGPTTTKFFEDIAALANKTLNFKGNLWIAESHNTLPGYADFITELLIAQLNSAQVEARVADAVKEDFAQKLQDSVGIDEKKSFLVLMDYAQSQSMSIAVAVLVNRLVREALEAATR